MAVTGTQTYTTTYTYDANGNLIRKSTSKGAERYDYNGFNQLTILKQGTTATGYAYNASGIRTAKHTENTDTYFLLDGGDVVAEYTDGEMTAHYVRGINLIRGKFGSNVRYYLFNAHGDVTVLTDGNGTLKKSYDYDAFGNEEKPSSSDTNPFRYCGEYFDKETGTYYLRARYYDPAIGRFTQQDSHWSPANAIYGDNPRRINERQDALGLNTYAYAPEISAIMQSGNLYVYCMNSPVLHCDSSGQSAELTLTWTGGMWWLAGADAMLPVGDLIYLAGIGACSVADAINTIGIDNIVTLFYNAEAGISNAVSWFSNQTHNVGEWISNTFGGGSSSPGGPNWDDGFKNFRQLKRHLGSPGKGNQWHHIVEQCQIKKSGFEATSIHNTKNVVSISTDVHRQISAFYSSKPDFTGGLTFRDWLAGQSFQVQYEWGIKILRMYGVHV